MRFVTRAVLALAIVVLPASAFAGIGIHANYDLTTIEGVSESFSFAGETELVSLSRTESSNPMGVGVDLTFGMLPIVDLWISLDASFATYDFVYDAPGTVADASEEGIPYLRAGGDFTVTISPIKFPPVVSVIKVFVGAGLTVGVQTPVVSREVIEENLTSYTELPDPLSYATAEVAIGYHAVAGVKIKPPAFPLALQVFGKYYMFPGASEGTPDSWLTAGAGLIIGF